MRQTANKNASFKKKNRLDRTNLNVIQLSEPSLLC